MGCKGETRTYMTSLPEDTFFINMEQMMDAYYSLALIAVGVLTGMGLAIQAGGATVAWISQLWGWMRRATFCDKFGQQMLGLSMSTFLGAALCALAALGLGYWRYQIQPQELYTELPWLVLSWPLGGLCMGLLFSLLATKTWKPLKRHKGVQSVLLLVAWISLWAGLYVGLNQYFLDLFVLSPADQVQSIEAMWRIRLSPVWILLAGQALVVGLGGTGTLGLAYLLARRNIEDYGRDYYRFALPHSAKWAALLLGQAFFLAWVVYRQEVTLWLLPQKEMIALGIALGGFVLYGLLLCIFLRSANPLRAKALALGACVFGIAAAVATSLSQIWLMS